MKHTKSLRWTALGLGAAFITVALSTAGASADDRRARVYRVRVTNLTKAQVFSPPVLATHQSSVGIFDPGQPASDELVKVAEDGMGGPLQTLLSSLPQVFEAQAADAPIPPGATTTYEIRTTRRFDRFSIVGCS